MRSYSRQQPGVSLFRCLGAALLFLLSAVPFRGYSPSEINYTGLLRVRPFLTLACLLPCLLLYAFLFIRAGLQKFPRNIWISKCAVVLVLTAAVILIPYEEKGGFLSSLHVSAAYADLTVFCLFLYQLIMDRRELVMIFTALLIPASLTALSALSINGTSELILSLMTAILLVFA